MMEIEASDALDEFARLMLESMAPWPVDCAGAFFWAYVEPGFSNFTHRLYRADGTPFLLTEPEPSWDAVDALLDIPDEIDPERAAVASILATYRVSDGSWVARVAFGDEARDLRPRPLATNDLARELCPL